MAPKIITLAPTDLVRLRGLNALFATAFEDPASYAGAPPSDGWLRDLLASDSFFAVVAETGGKLVGGLTAYELKKAEQQRREIYIYDLAVAADHRRQGIATALIRQIQAIAAKRGAWVVFVQADYGDDPAIALYQKLGHREEVLHFDIDPLAE